MAEPFIGEIRMWACDFAPRNWAFCNGELMPISQHTVLYAVIGTLYGGDGRATFGLPNLQGRAPMHPGQGPGLTHRQLGQMGGAAEILLTEAQMPAHTHTLRGSTATADAPSPQGAALATGSTVGTEAQTKPPNFYQTDPSDLVQLAPDSLQATGGSLPHYNMQPYQCVNFCIALEGLFPSRS